MTMNHWTRFALHTVAVLSALLAGLSAATGVWPVFALCLLLTLVLVLRASRP